MKVYNERKIFTSGDQSITIHPNEEQNQIVVFITTEYVYPVPKDEYRLNLTVDEAKELIKQLSGFIQDNF